MPTPVKPDADLKEAMRMCRVTICDCETLLKRTEEMLRRSQQDNVRRYGH